jgi:hypothetical protein
MTQRKFKPKVRNRITRFSKRPRAQRKLCYIQVKNEIRQQSPVIGGLFSTHSYIESNTAWIDIWFLSKRKPLVMYNVTLDTTLQAYRDAVWNAAFDATYDLNNESQMQELEMEVISRDPKTGMVTTRFPEARPRPEFGGLTSSQWQDIQEERIANSGEIRVYEKWTLHRDYRTGVGLHATIHEPYLTIEAINLFVTKFLEKETEYCGMQAFHFSYEQCVAAKMSGHDSNRLLNSVSEKVTMRDEYDFSNAVISLCSFAKGSR